MSDRRDHIERVLFVTGFIFVILLAGVLAVAFNGG